MEESATVNIRIEHLTALLLEAHETIEKQRKELRVLRKQCVSSLAPAAVSECDQTSNHQSVRLHQLLWAEIFNQ